MIYVAWRLDDCMAADGSAALPYCSVGEALGGVTTTRTTIVILGENPGFTINFGDIPLTITGGEGARVSAPTGTAVTLLGGNVTLREMLIAGSRTGVDITGSQRATLTGATLSDNEVGVWVHNRAGLQMDGCLVRDNSVFGIHKGGESATVSIENTVVVGNDRGASIESTPFGATTFRNNTFLDNTVVGAECITSTGGSPAVLSGNLAYGNGGGQVAGCGAPDACLTECSATDPLLDLADDRYRLTATSPASCKDVLDTAPTTDRKGTQRPQNAKSDCGADEYDP